MNAVQFASMILTTTSCFRDMSVEDAIELGQRSIYHATFRDAVSGGTVSGELFNIAYPIKSHFLVAAVHSDSNVIAVDM